MPLFDAYVMVDWSGSDRRRAGRQDCIWIAHGPSTADAPTTVSPPSRTEAEHVMRAQLRPIVAAKKGRVLLCGDFGYGYPAGFASLISESVSGEVPPWRIVWQYLKKYVHDDLGTKPGRQPTNRSNRFEVASAINAAVSSPASPGPFWCLFKPGNYACVPQKRPAQPFICTTGTIASLRITDRRAHSDSPFRLFGTGSVGSQVLTGIPRLESIRFDPEFIGCSTVWPFETGWGRRRLGHGSILSCELCTPRFILVSEHLSGTRLKTAVRCALCGTGRANSTQRAYSLGNSRSHQES